MTEPSTPVRLATFAEFYPFYLGEHANRTCRRLHFVGTSLGLGCFIAAAVHAQPSLILLGLLLGYGWYFPQRRLMLIFPPIPMPARVFVALYGTVELVLGVTGTASRHDDDIARLHTDERLLVSDRLEHETLGGAPTL